MPTTKIGTSGGGGDESYGYERSGGYGEQGGWPESGALHQVQGLGECQPFRFGETDGYDECLRRCQLPASRAYLRRNGQH